MSTRTVFTILTLATISFASLSFGGNVRAADSVALEDLERFEGIWKSEYKNEQGIDVITYWMHVINDDVGVMMSFNFTVNAETKEIDDWFRGFVGVNQTEQQFDALYFSADGWVGEATMVPTDTGFVTDLRVGLPDKSHFSMTVTTTLQSDMQMKQSWADIIYSGMYASEGPVRHSSKIDRSFRELVESGQIVFPEDSESPEQLAPLARLEGNWESSGAEGPSHKLRWRLRVGSRWLVEQFRIANGEEVTGIGINVSGIDPITEQLSLWRVNRNGLGRIGTWDVISDQTLGQVQGNYRIIREFNDDNTKFTAHWQERRNGQFVDIPESAAAPYTAVKLGEDE